MAATKTLNIRLSPERKAALQDLADAFGESLTEFVLKSVYARVRQEKAPSPAADPFVVALRAAAQGRRHKLSADEKAAVQKAREARRQGAKTLSVAEARRRLLA